MKKKLWIPLIAAGFLAVFCLGFLLTDLTIKRSFDQLTRGYDSATPAREAQNIGVLIEGDYPGLSDEPVTAEEALPGRKAMYALRQQKYSWILPFLKPHNGGIAIGQARGCSPEEIAYWDGRYLWLPQGFGNSWTGYAPSSPKELEDALQAAYKLQKEIRS